MRPRALHILLVLLTCLAIYWPMLGTPGFGSSEGHRVGPAWEMLDTGGWTHLRLFGQTYLRKPPGMPWAIAISSSILGQTEFAARAVSALTSTFMALFALWFTTRWLGPLWGFAAGLAQALSPLFITIGRTAEIEPLNALATQVAAFAMLSLLNPLARPGGRSLVPLAPILLMLGIVLAGVAKGPASLPVFLGIVIAACLQARSITPLRSLSLWISITIAGAILVAFAWWFAGVNRDPDAVTQDFSEFTWSLSRVGGTALLLPASFVAAIPTSFAILVFLGQRRRARSAAPPRERDPDAPLAGILTLSWVCAVVLLMLAGSSNPRYAMPAGVLLAPLAGWALRACWRARRSSRSAGIAMLGHPVVPGVILFVMAVIWVQLEVRRPRYQEGRHTGAAIAQALPHSAVVWANDLVEARPDALLYAKAAAAHDSRHILPLWKKSQILAGELPSPSTPAPHYLLLREDPESQELHRYRESIASGALRRVAAGRLAKYQWVLLAVETPAAAPGAPPPSPTAPPPTPGSDPPPRVEPD